jgi:DNA polymerase-1
MDIVDLYKKCSRCPGCGGKVLPELPPLDSQIKGVIVGERPGEEELKEGKPFIGPSGKLLFNYLNRDEWVITNVIKCQYGIAEGCKELLEQELEYILNTYRFTQEYPVILLLGKVATETLSPYKFHASLSGAYYLDKDKRVLVVISVHPAYVLRNKVYPLLKRALKVANKGIPFKFNPDTEQVDETTMLRVIEKMDVVAVDIEVVNGIPVSIAVSNSPDKGYVSKLTPEIARTLATKKLIGHNLAFDIPVLEQVGRVEVPAENIHGDTAVFYHWEWSEFRKGLDNLTMLVGMGEYKQEFLSKFGGWNGISNTSRSLFGVPKELYIYNGLDAVASYRLHKYLSPSINARKKLRHLWNVFRYFMKSMMEIEQTGVYVNTGLLCEERVKLQQKSAELTTKLNDLGFNGNPLSPKQVLEYFRKKGHNISSTSEAVLTDLAEKFNDEVAKTILEYRHTAKLLSTYVEGFLEVSGKSPDGRVRSKFNITGTPTHRLASSDPNLQNLPPGWYGTVITAPKGKKLVGLDYSQIELRMLAQVSGDPVMIDEFQQGLDLHTITARDILHYRKVDENARREAKAINFGMVYGLTAPSLARALNCDEATAERVINRFFQKYSVVREWRERVYEFAREHGYVESLFGRRRWVLISEESGKNLFNVSVNSVIQASAMDIVQTDMGLIYMERGKSLPDAFRFVSQVHDAIYFEVDEDFDPQCIKDFIENGWDLDVPIKVKVETYESSVQS